MQPTPTSHEAMKKKAALEAVRQVESHMVLGLGTGSTAKYAIIRIGELLASGELQDIVGLPSSRSTVALARQVGIPLVDFEKRHSIDLTIDGADEVDSELDVIKGGGGALLYEKIVFQASRRTIVIVDESKLSPRLGMQWPVPVETIPFARHVITARLEEMGASITVRGNGEELRTDEDNVILDANFGPIDDKRKLADALANLAGVVEHGLFLGLTTEVIVARADKIEHFSMTN